MRQERFYEPHKQGLEKLTGDNTGLFYINERTEQEPTEEGGERTVYVYDVYEISDTRNHHQVKNEVIVSEHPFGDENRIIRKALAKLLKAQKKYDSEDFAEFKQYNEFVENI